MNDSYFKFVFTSINIIRNMVKTNTEYLSYIKELYKYTHDDIEDKYIEELINKEIQNNSSNTYYEDNMIIMKGYLEYAKKLIMDKFDIDDISKIIQIVKDKNDKRLSKIIMNNLIDMYNTRNIIIFNECKDISDSIWLRYKQINPEISVIDRPSILNTIIQSIVCLKYPEDLAYTEFTMLDKLKHSSEYEIDLMLEMYKYMPDLFSKYFNEDSILIKLKETKSGKVLE